MPRNQPRGSNGQFISGDISLPLPSFIGLYKILIVVVLIFPWYAILSNRNVSSTLFHYIIGKNFTDDCECSRFQSSANYPPFPKELYESLSSLSNTFRCDKNDKTSEILNDLDELSKKIKLDTTLKKDYENFIRKFQQSNLKQEYDMFIKKYKETADPNITPPPPPLL